MIIMPRRSRPKQSRKSPRRTRSRRQSSPGPKSSRKPSKTRDRCRKLVSDKIRINMREYNNGRWASRKQAIAVSFATTRRQHPWCSRFFLQKRKR